MFTNLTQIPRISQIAFYVSQNSQKPQKGAKLAQWKMENGKRRTINNSLPTRGTIGIAVNN